MRKRIISIISTHTFRSSAVTSISTFLTAGLGAVFYLLVAKALGAKEYGLFSLVMTFFTLGVTIGDVGMGQSLIRFVGASVGSTSYYPYAKLALIVKLFLGSVLFLLFWSLTGPIVGFFHHPEISQLLPVIGIAIPLQLLLFLALVIFQGQQRFFLWGGIQVGSNMIRLLILGIIIMALPATSGSMLSGFSLAIFLATVISWAKLDKRFIFSKVNGQHIKEFFDFSKWTAAFMALSSLVSRMDIFLLAKWGGDLKEVGIYSLGVSMASFLPQLGGALGAVTSPKFAGFQDVASASRYLKKSTLFVSLSAIAVTLVMIPAALLVVWFTGRDFQASFKPFLILLSSFTIFLFTNPQRDCLLYYYRRPDFFWWLNLGQGTVLVLTSFFLIPTYGVVGAAFSVFVSHIFTLLASIWFYKKIS